MHCESMQLARILANAITTVSAAPHAPAAALPHLPAAAPQQETLSMLQRGEQPTVEMCVRDSTARSLMRYLPEHGDQDAALVELVGGLLDMGMWPVRADVMATIRAAAAGGLDVPAILARVKATVSG